MGERALEISGIVPGTPNNQKIREELVNKPLKKTKDFILNLLKF